MQPIIKVEGLGKQYWMGRQKRQGYTALRDVLTEGAKNLFSRSGNKGSKQEPFWALRDINFEVAEGEVLGVIGPNGAGKSTLLKILSRITEPTVGRATLRGRVASLLEVGTGFHPELTGRENIFLSGAILGMQRSEIRRQFAEIVDFSGVESFLDTPVKRYSSGMRVRLGFAVAAHLQPEILLVDEVLAVGDAEFQKKCLGKMDEVARGGRTVLFVSHNLRAVQKLCPKAMLLENGIQKVSDWSKNVITQYLDTKQKNEVFFYGKPLQWVKVTIEDAILSIHAKYKVSGKVQIPNLGFVIYDIFGSPITGSNPMMLNQERGYKNYPSKGEIKVKLRNLMLLDGDYIFSFWFGIQPNENIQVEKQSLKVAILGMSKLIGPQNSNAIGSVFTECEYHFFDQHQRKV